VWAIVFGVLVTAVGGVSLEWLRTFFALSVPAAGDWLVVGAAGAGGAALVAMGGRVRRS
jgi:hypothetical protein